MPDDINPYTSFEPGQLITAEVMNEMQNKIRDDIAGQIITALEALTEIENANNSDKLGGETSKDLLDRFLERAMEHIPGQTGYRKLFKVLRLDRPSLIEHKLDACPLVDLYALAPFDAVCAVDDDKTARLTAGNKGVKFYLYHTSEKKLRHPDGGSNPSIVIEETDGPIFRIPWSKMLDQLEVEYTPKSSLGDLETEFWTAMFADPNDQFDPDEYCHSPWFERCCREERTVESLKEKGDWDELWLKMIPRKTVNLAFRPGVAEQRVMPLPVNAAHLSLDTVGLAYLTDDLSAGLDAGAEPNQPERICLMVLLKV